MRLSKFPLTTTKETPADAAIVSHQLMLRGGFIRQLGSGLYSWMPIGLRVLHKIAGIVREEMDAAGAMEVLMPSIHPAELWQESGRWDAMGEEMLRLQDRHGNDFCYGPTHEEVITHHVRQDVRSYRQLPVNFYQIQTKFRDERRPRFGVMRAREFIMKDAYSFHMDTASLSAEYENMRAAYTRIFTRLGVDFRSVVADSGAIGGARSEEFHILAQAGEDLLAISTGSGYAANVEAAELKPAGTRALPAQSLEKVSTPVQKTCAEVASLLQLPIQRTLKLIVVRGAGGGLVALALRGDHTLNPLKAVKHPKIASPLTLADDDAIRANFNAEPGFLGPVSIVHVPVIADHAAAVLSDFVCGANESGHHYTGANWLRDAAEPETFDLRMVEDGDPSPDGQGTIKLYRGIEGGHIFQLGQKYSKAMGLTVLDETGTAVTPEMGCYGIGVSRLAAAVIEQRNDANGILWPDAIAPFHVILCPIGLDKSAAVKAAAETLYEGLKAAGIDVLLDDRGLRPGAMFADADLIGIPHRVVIGDKGLANAQFEYKRRDGAAVEIIPATVEAVREKLGA